MNLYKLTQDENRGYDTFDSVIVAAETEEEARCIHPSDNRKYDVNRQHWVYSYRSADKADEHGWVTHPRNVKITLIGVADASITEPGVILASFNAG